MTAYIATFHTHLSALLTCRALTAAGVELVPLLRAVETWCARRTGRVE